MADYCSALKKQFEAFGKKVDRTVTSIYFGGGTPSVLKGEQIAALIDSLRLNFNISDEAEITVEANPDDPLDLFLPAVRAAGVNRISFGAQSANDDELKLLGRRHSANAIREAVYTAREIGFDNISLDLMLGLPKSDISSLQKSLEFITSLSPEHISAYILKAEENTPMYDLRNSIPDDDNVADQYLFVCNYLRQKGYSHYEISNFAKDKKYSNHNILYWHCGEYIGFGPSAHSNFNFKRFSYSNDIISYIKNPTVIPQGLSGGKDEYIMLGLRLNEGICSEEFEKRFVERLPKSIFDKATLLSENRLCSIDGNRIYFTDEGMLVSNSIITSFLEEL